MILPTAIAWACLQAGPGPVAPERVTLGAHVDESLGSLRASGSLVLAEPAGEGERSAFREAEERARELLALRGGELDNDTLLTVLLVLGIVALLVILL